VEAPALASRAAASFRDPSQIVESWQAPDFSPGPRSAIYVHFDARGDVAPYVLHGLAELRANGLDTLLVSNAGRLNPDAMAALRQVAHGVLVRRNIGYDFGAMREGLAHWRLPGPATQCVILTNDSVLGPFSPLAPLLARLDFAAADLWAAVDSRQRRYHLQSWFMAAGARALRDPAWAQFWDGVRPVQHKEWVIGRYEVGLTQAMLRAGLRVRALWSADALLARARVLPPDAGPLQRAQHARREKLLARGVTLNPTADLWRELWEAGCPFIKRELVTRNPAHVQDVADWRHLVPAGSLKRLGL
jgi:lipopolysaccharide biosynthesis protein